MSQTREWKKSNMTPVNSSNVTHIHYDPERQVLKVKFKGGTTYEYHDVSQEKHDALMASDSIGNHLHKHVKPHHRFNRLNSWD